MWQTPSKAPYLALKAIVCISIERELNVLYTSVLKREVGGTRAIRRRGKIT